MTSPVRSVTPVFNGNGNTRPTSPASSSPLRHTIAGTNLRSRDASRERQPLDYTDLEGNPRSYVIESLHQHCSILVMAKVQLESEYSEAIELFLFTFSMQIYVKLNGKLLSQNVTVSCSN